MAWASNGVLTRNATTKGRQGWYDRQTSCLQAVAAKDGLAPSVNEWGYSNRLVDIAELVASKL